MTTEVQIHPSAIVEKGAQLGVGVKIGPYSTIGSTVVVSDAVKIHSHAVIRGHTKIGRGTEIWSHTAIGTEPQHLKYKGEPTELIIGEDNKIREYANLSVGTVIGGGRTIVGARNLLMMSTHIAHDCIVGDDCIFANAVSLGGHVEIGSRTVIGGHVAIHQFCKIGDVVMIGGGSIVVQDVLHYCLVEGNRAVMHGLNLVGLRRAALSEGSLQAIKTIYKILFRQNRNLDQATHMIQTEISACPERDKILSFLNDRSERGICR